jgi:hypothetical protein
MEIEIEIPISIRKGWKVSVRWQKSWKLMKLIKTDIKDTKKYIIIKACINSLIRSGYIDTKLNHTDFIRNTTNLFFAAQ